MTYQPQKVVDLGTRGVYTVHSKKDCDQFGVNQQRVSGDDQCFDSTEVYYRGRNYPPHEYK